MADGFSGVNVGPMSDNTQGGSRIHPGEPQVEEVSSEGQDFLDAIQTDQQSESHHGGGQRIQQRVVNETKIYNNNYYHYRVDKDFLHNIKKKTSEFMSLGRTEFNKNLEKWQDFFEET